MNRVQLLLKLNETKGRLQGRYIIKRPGLFGAFARDERTGASDVDPIVEFLTPVGIEFVELADEIEDELQTKVDLVPMKGIKKHYLYEVKSEIIYV
ncbi:hypothetical protein AUK22_02140 [bacterium CG2_30_54_10]|nr:MAG: hypothetical protein AUK22_02140 [bacterium CG2_30_54_10]